MFLLQKKIFKLKQCAYIYFKILWFAKVTIVLKVLPQSTKEKENNETTNIII